MLNYNQTKSISFIFACLYSTLTLAKFPTWSLLSPEHDLYILQLNRIATPQGLVETETKTKQTSQVVPLVAPYYLHVWVRPSQLKTDPKTNQKIQLPAENGQRHQYEIYHPKTIDSFVVGSCTHQTILKEDMQKVWNAVYNTKPDVIILGGDNVYTDYYLNYKISQTRDNLARAFIHGIERIPLYSQDTLIPLVTTWDDHDYGLSDGNKTFKLKNEALKIFQAIYSPWEKSNPNSIYQNYSQSHPHYEIYLLDGRSDRDPSGGTTHLGSSQFDWLEQKLKTSKKKPLIIKGDQFFGGYHRFESYEKDHPIEFNNFKKILAELKTNPVLISGDRHLSEHQAVKLGNTWIHEWTSSPMHSKLFPRTSQQKASDNPNRKWVEDSKYNFLKFTLSQTLKVEAFDADGNLLYAQ